MFQNFEPPESGQSSAAHLAALRRELAARGLAGFIIPQADAHMNETLAASDRRLTWATGFTGSAGTAVVMAETAAIFVDGRYTIQARQQCDPDLIEVIHFEKTSPQDWIAAQAEADASIGFDPWLHGKAEIARFEAVLGDRLRAVETNPIDACWADRPPPPMGAVVVHPESLSGESSESKRRRLGAQLRKSGAEAAVITRPDSIAWLLNIRGGDLPHVPVALGFAVLGGDGAVQLFMDPDKVDGTVRAHLGNEVSIAPVDTLGSALAQLTGTPVRVDERSAPVWIVRRLEEAGAGIDWGSDPCTLPKALKNATELEGMRAAHRRDGVAMSRFLHWLDTQAAAGATLDEIQIAEKVEACRVATGALRDISFDTISAAGPNAALAHYRVNRDSNRTLSPGEILLVDSGGQYADGTTDITRTMAYGPVLQEAVRPFTLVLKGMIAIARARWPAGHCGRDLDPLARRALWAAGLNYDHGTGHGVGTYLDVHEGPQRLARSSAVPLEPGMILSDEPGYYREGAFGIRIEILVAVTPAEVPPGGELPMLGFEVLTLCPIDRRLIDTALMERDEIDWLNAYHARVLATVGPELDADARAWLRAACAPLYLHPSQGGPLSMSEAFTIEPATGVYSVRAGGAILVESSAALILREKGYDPVIYFPRADVGMEFLDPSDTRTTCPHKGEATYFHIGAKSGPIKDAAWSYETPVAGAEAIAGYIAFDTEKAAVEGI